MGVWVMGVFSLYSITVYSECYIHMDERLTKNGEGAMQKTREAGRSCETATAGGRRQDRRQGVRGTALPARIDSRRAIQFPAGFKGLLTILAAIAMLPGCAVYFL